MIQADGKKSFLGGNLGAPFIGAAAEDWDWGVVEISSFQLEWIEQFRPRIARHAQPYGRPFGPLRVLCRLLRGQGAHLRGANRRGRGDPQSRRSAGVGTCANGLRLGWSPSVSPKSAQGVFATADEIVWRDSGVEERFALGAVKIHGVHNVENMMAAVAAAKCAGCRARADSTNLEDFPGLEHRLEFVREKDGVRYYNDSKGTNVGAVVKSLASFAGPVILLAGGVDKGGDYGAP